MRAEARNISSVTQVSITSYFLTRENLSRLKKVAQPSIAYELPVYSSVVFLL